MLLSARILESVSGVNSFDYVDQGRFTEGDTPTIYLQLIDAAKDRPQDGFVPAGRRYMPIGGATLQVTFVNLDASKQVVRFATQPFPQDPSIWAVTLLATDAIRGTVSLRLLLSESGKLTKGSLQAALAVESVSGLV